MGSTKLHHDHYRALERQVKKKMCTSRNNPGHQNSEEIQWQSGLYPDLSGLFGGETGERRPGEEGQGSQGSQGTPAATTLLLRLLGLSQDQLRPAPSPSAPPAEEQQQQQQVLYALLSFTDPLLMTFICIFAIHKTVVRKKPLIDLNYWKRRIAGMENNRMN